MFVQQIYYFNFLFFIFFYFLATGWLLKGAALSRVESVARGSAALGFKYARIYFRGPRKKRLVFSKSVALLGTSSLSNFNTQQHC